jgi:large subunit ribosomal protein L30
MTKISKPTETSAKPKTIRIRQVRSGICTPVDQKAALVGLGLKNIRDVVVREDTPSVRGQVRKIRHLVEIIGIVETA